MKKKITTALAALAVAVVAPSTQANTRVIMSASSFHAVFASEVQWIDFNGVQRIVTNNNLNASIQVTAPIPHLPSVGGAGFNVYIDGFGPTQSGNAAMQCTVAASNFDGSNIITKSVTAPTQVTNWEKVVSFTTTEVSAWTYMAITCSMPKGGTANLYGVTIE